MRNFQDTFETHKLSLINAFSFYVTVPSNSCFPKHFEIAVSLGKQKFVRQKWEKLPPTKNLAHRNFVQLDILNIKKYCKK